MSHYVSVMVTEVGVTIEDKARFEREVAELEDVMDGMFKNTFEIFELEEQSDGEWVLDLRGTEGASLELCCDLLPDVLGKLPPEDWTDAQKEAHARTFGYPVWIDTVATDDVLDVVGFLQRHIKPGTYAVFMGVDYEGLRDVGGWVCAFTKDDCEWDGLWRVTSRLIDKLGVDLSVDKEEKNT